MRIFVNCFGITQIKEVSQNLTVEQFLNELKTEENLPFNSYLVSEGTALPNEEMISDLLNDNSNVNVAIELRGGGKKGGKKRKAYTTPKKNKHKRVNVKKAALSYFAIENDGTVKRVKKRSMQVGCKHRGIFMANHWNRYYCGYSHLTLMKKDAPKEEPKRVKKAAAVEEKKDDKKKGKGKKK